MASQWNTVKAKSNAIRPVDEVLPAINGKTEIRYKGKALSVTPKSNSMTIIYIGCGAKVQADARFCPARAVAQ